MERRKSPVLTAIHEDGVIERPPGLPSTTMAKRKANGLNTAEATTEGSSPATKDSDELITSLNALSASAFQEKYIKPSHLAPPSPQLSITFKSSASLTKGELNQCFDLISLTSRSHYEPSSFGWHSRRKLREMREEEMRYLLVRSTTLADRDGDSAVEGEVKGFLSFMLTHDSSPAVPVVYVYEIHLLPELRQCGLGGHLMQVAEDVARATGVEKVMLTCFVANETVRRWYEGRGYGVDVVSPEDRMTRRKVVKADYVIMSKAVK
ncbi:uncharacterized protein LTR77_003518 [Saxophila tyrrhenica]|uniref:N-alpha-acetyltransferase 40 n=1 Tax=Saxophila tyrrhenica TaxID=1690608 RepID=A0AAV9PGR6_9PEZI|nr:hypothetical protein LTR77_003518 [Saxophila tyrrhenica]